VFRSINSKFYAIAISLTIFFSFGYSLLAYFLHQQNQSAVLAQEAILLERDFGTLNKLFHETRFWERMILSQKSPEADKRFGFQIEQIRDRLLTLSRKELDATTKSTFRQVIDNINRYETDFNRLIQLKIKQSILTTRMETNYRSMVHIILNSNNPALIKPLFNLTHFLMPYRSGQDLSKYQALKLVINSFEKKLQSSGISDVRMKGYLESFKNLLDKGYEMEMEILVVNEEVERISSQLKGFFADISVKSEVLQKKQFQETAGIRQKLQIIFLLSAVLGIGFLLIFLRLISRNIIIPIRSISQVMQEVKDGNILARFQSRAKQKDEIIQFGFSFNDMLDTLETHNRHLEDLVKERTRELEKEKERAETANQAKSEFLSNMSHEIRTPLNAVTGFSELLTSLVTDKKQKTYLKSIRTAGKTLLSLINDILDLSKIEAGKMEIQYTPVNPQIIFDEIKQIFNTIIVDKELEFHTDIDNNLPSVLFLDETRLRQVLLNIVGNAIKFTKEGFIALSVKKDFPTDDHNKIDLIISVKDTGIGIPEADQDKIFEVFEQQNGQSNRSFGGTGLGLSISKKLAEMMNGRIEVTSKVDEGSTFTLFLKDVGVSAIELPAFQESIFDSENIVFEKAKILVVDDVRSNREFLSELLTLVNLDVLTAENGQEAILLSEWYRPDAIIMDIRMPIIDGFDAARYLKENRKSKEIPIIALSASPNAEHKQQLFDIGIANYLTKPITKNRLLYELSRHLHHTGKTTSITVDDEQLINDRYLADIKDRSGLIKILKEEITPLSESLKRVGKMSEIIAFGSRVKELGDTFNVRVLLKYGDDICEYAQNYDLPGIEAVLKKIPSIIKIIDALPLGGGNE